MGSIREPGQLHHGKMDFRAREAAAHTMPTPALSDDTAGSPQASGAAAPIADASRHPEVVSQPSDEHTDSILQAPQPLEPSSPIGFQDDEIASAQEVLSSLYHPMLFRASAGLLRLMAHGKTWQGRALKGSHGGLSSAVGQSQCTGC